MVERSLKPSVTHCQLFEMAEVDPKKATSIYEFTVKNIDGDEVKLDKYRGKVSELLLHSLFTHCIKKKVYK